MTAHQANHARILALRSQVVSLNSTITSTLTTLADTHREIVSQKITPFTDDSRQVPHKDLLEYAARISRYTVPPEPRRQRKSAQAEAGLEQAAAPVNGADTGTQQDVQAAQDAQKEEEQSLKEPQAPFVPWPDERLIKLGALGRIQAMLENGQDPAVFGPPEVGEGEPDEILKDTEIDNVGATAPVEPTKTQEAPTREVQAEQKPKVFGGLDLYDPDDMDDD